MARVTLSRSKPEKLSRRNKKKKRLLTPASLESAEFTEKGGEKPCVLIPETSGIRTHFYRLAARKQFNHRKMSCSAKRTKMPPGPVNLRDQAANLFLAVLRVLSGLQRSGRETIFKTALSLSPFRHPHQSFEMPGLNLCRA